MTSEVPLLTLGRVATIAMGQSPNGDDCNRVATGSPLLNGPTEFGLSHPKPAQWTTSPTKWAEVGDVLFCVRGSTTGRMNRADQRYVIGRGIAAIRGPRLIDTAFVHYALKDRLAELLQMTTGSTFPNISRDSLASLLIPWPAEDVRSRIAGVLGALDDLIETNLQLARQCEALARALVAGSPELTPLSSFATWGGFATVRPSGSVDHFSLPAFDDGMTPDRTDGSTIKSNKQRVDQDCVLVSRLNPHIPRVWMVYPESATSSLASTEFVPILGDGVPAELIYAVCSSPEYLRQMNSLVSGTTGSHQRVDKGALTSVEVPDLRHLSNGHCHAIVSLVREAHGCRQAMRELAAVRNELIPLLLSGRVSVREVAA